MAQAKVDLGLFEGLDVIQSSIRVVRAGDGLSKAMALDPVVLHTGQDVTIVIRCKVGSIIHRPIKDTESLERVQTLEAGSAAIIDDQLVAKLLDEQKLRLEQAAGVQRLPMDDDD